MTVEDDDGFEQIVQQAGREFMGSPLRFQPEKPFYHYTTATGLAGILDNEAIWATDHRFLNDPDELTRGERAIQAELDMLIRVYGDDTARGDLCRRVRDGRDGNRVVDMPDVGIYVASFSSEPELLGQWCRYADDARGYAIGFTSIPLPTGEPEPSELEAELAVDFGPCIYTEDDYRARVREILFYVADGMEKYLRTFECDRAQCQAIIHQALTSAMARIGSSVWCLKHPSFYEEKEWRLIQIGTPPGRLFRDTAYGSTPYIEVSMRKETGMAIHEVIVGPKGNREFAMENLNRSGYANVTVTASRLPYR